MERPRCIVTVDVEEWADALLSGVPRRAREMLSPTIEPAIDVLLDLLDRHRASATFFVLGTVARRHPELVRRIGQRHEIACHGDTHTCVRTLGRARFDEELAAARGELENLAGRPVVGYRAPSWSLAGTESWSLPVLASRGFRYDSSLIPGRGGAILRRRGEWRREPHRLESEPSIWEFPPSVARLPGRSVPVAGGACLRLLPPSVLLAALGAEERAGRVPHVYIHPWEVARPTGASAGRARRASLLARVDSVPGKLDAILGKYRGIPLAELWRELDGGADGPVTPRAVQESEPVAAGATVAAVPAESADPPDR